MSRKKIPAGQVLTRRSSVTRPSDRDVLRCARGVSVLGRASFHSWQRKPPKSGAWKLPTMLHRTKSNPLARLRSGRCRLYCGVLCLPFASLMLPTILPSCHFLFRRRTLWPRRAMITGCQRLLHDSIHPNSEPEGRVSSGFPTTVPHHRLLVDLQRAQNT